MKVTTTNKQGEVIYSRVIEADKEHTAKVLSQLMDVPQGDAYSTNIETGVFSHTFKHDHTLCLRTLIARVEGIALRTKAAVTV